MPKQERRADRKQRSRLESEASSAGKRRRARRETGGQGNRKTALILSCSFILVDLGVPAFLQFLVVRSFALNLAELHFQPLACT
jgi:hypothetical protein